MQYGASYIGRTFKLLRTCYLSETLTLPPASPGVLKAVDEKNALLLLVFSQPRIINAWLPEAEVQLDASVLVVQPKGTTEQADDTVALNKATLAHQNDLTPVTSSNLAAIGFQVGLNMLALEQAKGLPTATGRLVVRFKNGVLWAYDGVQAELFTQILEAESPGKVYNSKVKGNEAFHASKLSIEL